MAARGAGPAAARSSPTSRRSSRCTSRCRSTPAASACWPATTARRPATSACRSSASASCIRRATSTSGCRTTAGSRSTTSASTGPTRRSRPPSRPTASRASPRCRSATAPCSPPCGACASVTCACICSTPTWRRTRRGIASLSARLYGGDRETRIQQEVILGIGGVRVLRAMGIEPAVWHLNEGHAAFVVLQRIREFIEQGKSFDDALEAVRASTVFTTHTPVPAGHDAFPYHLVEKHLAGCWGDLGQHRARFLALGEHDSGHGSQFNMTALAMRAAGGHQRRERAARPRHARDVARHVARPSGRRRAGAGHHQRRARADLGRGARCANCSRRISATTGSRGSTIPPRGIASTPSPTPSCGGCGVQLRDALFAWIRERARQRWTIERVAPPRVVDARRRCSTRRR